MLRVLRRHAAADAIAATVADVVRTAIERGQRTPGALPKRALRRCHRMCEGMLKAY